MLNSLAYSLLFPPNVLVAMVVLALLLLLLKRRISAIFTLILGLTWVLIWSLPATSLLAGGWLEHRFERLDPSAYPPAQAIVVLGGHIQGNRRNWFEPFDRANVIGRESLAAELYHAKKAPLIVLSGGALEGNVSDTANMARSLERAGVPSNAIVQETESQSTQENAELTQKTLQALNLDKILLVTSALHMPRAMAAFQDTRISVIAAPLARQIELPNTEGPDRWSPDLHTLMASRSIIKEYVGLVVFWLDDLKSRVL